MNATDLFTMGFFYYVTLRKRGEMNSNSNFAASLSPPSGRTAHCPQEELRAGGQITKGLP